MSGPLSGLRILEVAGLGAAPFGTMLLSDLGAQVLRIVRPRGSMHDLDPRFDVLARGRRSLVVDLRSRDAVASLLAVIENTDVLIEGFRPGVMERLGLGPQVCMARQPALVYGRMTGWGQEGPLAMRAGHDINYIALTGALHAIGPAGQAPVPPLNYVGDFGGGGMLLAVGILAALHETRQSGMGQVVDAAMIDGAALLSASKYGMKAAGRYSSQRGDNLVDGGAPFYSTYVCADGKYIALGAIEPQFFAILRARCGLDGDDCAQSFDKRDWPALRAALARLFLTRTRAQWSELLEDADACVSPVLDWDEAPRHRHNVAREAFFDAAGVLQPSPAPRFSRTSPARPGPALPAGQGCGQLLHAWGVPAAVTEHLLGTGGQGNPGGMS
ncbi:CoA transferase [Alcaligenaceae bacterium]|nr:CoA transferase [Alcaligenaceae bacterium]